ncbi:DUF6985 domain-containing protein [Leptospira interrogans serovar Szwajizak]|uniref:DUF6985 domain-containing protein n=1 Tax=Leptospira interrogans TaxID=173 RepID=UPI0003478C12|nr:hypothetical protein [Leptospira interrogans]
MDLLKFTSSPDAIPEGKVWFALLNTYMDFSVENSVNVDDVFIVAKRLNSLSSEVIDECCAAAMRYRTAFLKVIGKPDLPIAQKSDILKCIYPGTLIISNSNLSNDSPVIHLELNCEWEPEHGMEWNGLSREIQFFMSDHLRVLGSILFQMMNGISYRKNNIGQFPQNQSLYSKLYNRVSNVLNLDGSL